MNADGDRRADRQTDRQEGRQTGRPTDRQTDRQTEKGWLLKDKGMALWILAEDLRSLHRPHVNAQFAFKYASFARSLQNLFHTGQYLDLSSHSVERYQNRTLRKTGFLRIITK